MHRSEHRPLTQDDFDGLHALYPSCAPLDAARPSCTKPRKYTGLLRLLIAVAVPFTAATAALLLTQVIARWVHGKRVEVLESRVRKGRATALFLRAHASATRASARDARASADALAGAMVRNGGPNNGLGRWSKTTRQLLGKVAGLGTYVTQSASEKLSASLRGSRRKDGDASGARPAGLRRESSSLLEARAENAATVSEMGRASLVDAPGRTRRGERRGSATGTAACGPVGAAKAAGSACASWLATAQRATTPSPNKKPGSPAEERARRRSEALAQGAQHAKPAEQALGAAVLLSDTSAGANTTLPTGQFAAEQRPLGELEA